MLSIVNPKAERNGAATVTQGLLKLLALPPFQAQVDFVPVRAEPPRWGRIARARSLVGGMVSTLPAKAAFLYSREFREKVEARIRSERYDLIIVNGSDLLWISEYLPPAIPRILVAHNIEHLLFNSQIQNLSWAYRPLRVLLRKDCQRLQDFEWQGIRIIRNVIFLSNEEAAYAGRFCEDLRSITIPPVFDYKPARHPPKKTRPTLEVGFLGNLGWWPNQLGLRWFANEILPYVKSSIRFNVFGQHNGHGWRDDRRIVRHGVVNDIEQIWAICDFMICPALSTGGVCVKLAEAAYNRIPAVATRHAARGLPLDLDPAIVLLDDPGEWVDFLNSTNARDLAGSMVSESTASRFALSSHRDVLQQFVKDVICSASLDAEFAPRFSESCQTPRFLI